MIKANELRIGNLIYLELGLPGLNLHAMRGQDVADIENGRITLSAIQPIPLTPEWLERCGFAIKHEATEEEPLTHSILKMDLDIAKEEEGYYLRYECQDSYYDSNIGVRIEYVHQLQNLFFALTGDELNVKI